MIEMRQPSPTSPICHWLLVAAAASGCSTQPTNDNAAVLLDSIPSVTLSAPRAQIGGAAGASDDFTYPIAVGRDARGSVYVLDARQVDIRRFASNGVYEAVVASAGEGPGELRSPTAVLVDSDVVRVWDGRTGRLATLATTGRVLGDTRTDLQSGRGGSTSLVQAKHDGTLIVRTIAESAPEPGNSRPTVSFAFVHATAGGEVLDTLYSWSAPAPALSLHGGRTRVLVPGPQIGPLVLFDTATQEIVAIDRPIPSSGTIAEWSMRRIDPEADAPALIRSFNVGSVPVPAEIRDSVRSQIAVALRIGGLPTTAGQERSYGDLGDVPKYYPAVERAVMDAGRRVWVKLVTDDSDGLDDWLVLDAALNPVYIVKVPVGLRDPLILADEIWGTMIVNEIPIVVGFSLPPDLTRNP